MIHYLVPAGQQSSIREYLERWGRGVAGRMRIVPYESLPDTTRLETGTYVLSAIEQLGPAMREFVAALHRKLHASEGFRFLNHPVRTLGRFELLTELHRLGRNDFRAVRATGDLSGLRYPVFLRAERSHDGAVSPLLDSVREVEAAIGRAVVRGRRARDLLVVEFSPTADRDGFFRKYAAFVVGDRILPRHLAHGPLWMVKHEGSDYAAAMLQEERDYVAGNNPHQAELAEICDIAAVEYGRIDYAIRDGRIQTWEINLHPTIGTPWNPADARLVRIERDRRPVHELFYAAFQAAWEAVDLASGGPAVPIDVDQATLRAAAAEARQHRPRRVDLAKWSERMRPVLDRVPTPFISWAGRLALRAGRRQP